MDGPKILPGQSINDKIYLIISEAQELRYTNTLEYGVNMLRNVITISLFMISTAYAEKPDWAKSEFYCEDIPDEMQTPDQNSGTYCPLVYVKPKVSLPFVYKPFSGFVIVKMKISNNGATENQIVDESTHQRIESWAVRAAQKLKFRPYVVDEKVVEIQNYYFKFNIQY